MTQQARWISKEEAAQRHGQTVEEFTAYTEDIFRNNPMAVSLREQLVATGHYKTEDIAHLHIRPLMGLLRELEV